jgi:murein DD-endopeptidase MepM/ murein hydrolase activator NlpD
MNPVYRWWVSVGGFVMVLLCLCVSLIRVEDLGLRTRYGMSDPNHHPQPGQSTCENAGVAYADNPFRGWPQTGRGWGDINYYYCAANYYDQFGRNHWGIDIGADFREPVYATAEGDVAWAFADYTYGMGNTVKVCHASGWCAIYMHLDAWVVEVGDTVVPGTLLGYADSTGFSTGNHLHYQINNPTGTPVDPAPTFS